MPDQDCSTSYIPLVDFSCLSLEHKDPPSPSDEGFQSLAKQIYDAFSTVGFVYLKNHGVQSEQVRRLVNKILHNAKVQTRIVGMPSMQASFVLLTHAKFQTCRISVNPP